MLDERVQAVFLRGHLALLDVGMRNSRVRGSSILKKAGAITGKTYKRGQYKAARNDLNAFIQQKDKENGKK